MAIAAYGLVVLLFALAQLGMPIAGLRVEYRAHGPDPTATRLLAGATLILLGIAMLRLVQMLGRIAAGELFGIDVIRRFRGFAFWLLMTALYNFLAPTLAGLLLPSGHGAYRIAILLDARELLIVGIAMLLFLLARLMERARELESEVREFV